MSNLESRPHVVYRMYDADDRLLYIGCTVDLDKRMSQHRSATPWVADIARIATEQYPNRTIALYIEAESIRDERPMHNKAHNLEVATPEGVFTGSMACKAAGISYRQLDYWCRQGMVTPSVRDCDGSGTRRLFNGDDIDRLKVLAEAAQIVAWANDGTIWDRVRNGQVWLVQVNEHESSAA